ncbi:MAG: DUF308 domain-containing protein [Promethearchaeota archaeon]
MAESQKESIPAWMRIVEIIIGILAIIFGILVFIAPTYISYLVFILAMCAVIILLGFGLIYRALTQKERTGTMRFLFVFGGIILIILGIYLYVDYTLFAALLLVWIFGIALAIDGILAITYAFTSLRIKNWQHWTLIIIGIIEAMLGLFVVVVPLFGVNVFNILAVIALIFVGIAYIIAGIMGERFVPSRPSAMGEE